MSSKKKIRFTVSRKIGLMVVLITLSLSLLLIALCYSYYKEAMFRHYAVFARNIGELAATELDTDRLGTYLDTLEKDGEYEREYRELCRIQEHSGIEYLYVVVPGEDRVYYVMDADTTATALPLGTSEAYSEGVFDGSREKMLQGEELEPMISDEELGWLMSVFYPMRTSSGEPAGYVGIDIRMDDVMNDLAQFFRRIVLLVAALGFVVSLVLFRITNRMVAVPIRKLSEAAKTLVKIKQEEGETETEIFRKLPFKTNDEISDLGKSLTRMERDMNSHIRELLTVNSEKARIGTELRIAKAIQAQMLPSVFPPFPDRKDFDIYATMTPALEVGGDFYDFFLTDEDHLALVMADVSGKGIPAAFFMTITRTLLKNRLMMGDSPAEALSNVNNQLCDGNEMEMFVTVWLAVLELSTGKGTAANAGHEHPALRRNGGKWELVIYRHSPAVAVMEDMPFKEHTFELKPGDSIFVYTDGVPEATDENETLFGPDRMLEALNRCPDDDPEALLGEVRKSIDEFVGNAPQFDDLTMLALHYHGPDHGSEKTDMVELTVEADVKRLDEVNDFIGAQLEQMDCSMKTQMSISLAVEEIFVNIASYAYAPGTGNAHITVECTEDPRSVRITFMDSGIPYNPLEKEDPDVTLSVDERQIGGLGIYMTKEVMDEVLYEYKDGQNVLTLVKKL